LDASDPAKNLRELCTSAGELLKKKLMIVADNQEQPACPQSVGREGEFLTQKRRLKPRFKLWLSSDVAEGAFGDGKWRLLKAIGKEGSLSAAAKMLGISYRKAWGDIKKAEENLGVALVEKQHGGKAGGSTLLTDAGKKWIEAYTQFQQEVAESAKNAFARHMEGL